MKKPLSIIGLILFGLALFSIVRASAIELSSGQPKATITVEEVQTQPDLNAVDADGTDVERTYNPQQ